VRRLRFEGGGWRNGLHGNGSRVSHRLFYLSHLQLSPSGQTFLRRWWRTRLSRMLPGKFLYSPFFLYYYCYFYCWYCGFYIQYWFWYGAHIWFCITQSSLARYLKLDDVLLIDLLICFLQIIFNFIHQSYLFYDKLSNARWSLFLSLHFRPLFWQEENPIYLQQVTYSISMNNSLLLYNFTFPLHYSVEHIS